jgi:RNA recognition motif. (a.k.a. RRM, RBD, or RNP domain)
MDPLFPRQGSGTDSHGTGPLPESHTETTRLYVGGILPEITESQLYNYFRKFGDVTRVEISQTSKGKSKRFGYVTLQSRIMVESLLKIKHKLSGIELRVEIAMGADQVAHKQLSKNELKLFVTGLVLKHASPFSVLQAFSKCADVTKVKLMRTDKKKLACCFITLANHADVKYLLEQKSLVLENFGTLVFHRFLPRSIREEVLSRTNPEIAFDLHQSASKPIKVGSGPYDSQENYPTVIYRKDGHLPIAASNHSQTDTYSNSALTLKDNKLPAPLLIVDSGIRQPSDPNLRFNIVGLMHSRPQPAAQQRCAK